MIIYFATSFIIVVGVIIGLTGLNSYLIDFPMIGFLLIKIGTVIVVVGAVVMVGIYRWLKNVEKTNNPISRFLSRMIFMMIGLFISFIFIFVVGLAIGLNGLILYLGDFPVFGSLLILISTIIVVGGTITWIKLLSNKPILSGRSFIKIKG